MKKINEIIQAKDEKTKIALKKLSMYKLLQLPRKT